ncbi:hypothetical protein DFJ74DRAFT_712841 [Hyaloraphidium curvatum]|nr:hypothetical protein DFJ74DRAFT_712841 [Hyaloraphidium curvatum]
MRASLRKSALLAALLPLFVLLRLAYIAAYHRPAPPAPPAPRSARQPPHPAECRGLPAPLCRRARTLAALRSAAGKHRGPVDVVWAAPAPGSPQAMGRKECPPCPVACCHHPPPPAGPAFSAASAIAFHAEAAVRDRSRLEGAFGPEAAGDAPEWVPWLLRAPNGAEPVLADAFELLSSPEAGADAPVVPLDAALLAALTPGRTPPRKALAAFLAKDPRVAYADCPGTITPRLLVELEQLDALARLGCNATAGELAGYRFAAFPRPAEGSEMPPREAYEALAGNTVPLVLPPMNVQQFPRGAAVALAAFSSGEEAAGYLKKVGREAFAWRRGGDAGEGWGVLRGLGGWGVMCVECLAVAERWGRVGNATEEWG